MTVDEFNNLKPGDVVQHVVSGDGYVVHDEVVHVHPKGRKEFIGVQTIVISNYLEWKKVSA